jgi:hypothetical protein
VRRQQQRSGEQQQQQQQQEQQQQQQQQQQRSSSYVAAVGSSSSSSGSVAEDDQLPGIVANSVNLPSPMVAGVRSSDQTEKKGRPTRGDKRRKKRQQQQQQRPRLAVDDDIDEWRREQAVAEPIAKWIREERARRGWPELPRPPSPEDEVSSVARLFDHMAVEPQPPASAAVPARAAKAKAEREWKAMSLAESRLDFFLSNGIKPWEVDPLELVDGLEDEDGEGGEEDWGEDEEVVGSDDEY